MNWVAPIVTEICVGMEVTSYDSADIGRVLSRFGPSLVRTQKEAVALMARRLFSYRTAQSAPAPIFTEILQSFEIDRLVRS